MDTYARHVVALLDHLGIERAVVGGVSLGGNVSLLVAAQAPERVQGMVIEMPVLEWAIPAAAITFVPMLLAVHFARPLVRRTASLFQHLPRTGNGPLNSVMNSLSNDPTETAAVLHGISGRAHRPHRRATGQHEHSRRWSSVIRWTGSIRSTTPSSCRVGFPGASWSRPTRCSSCGCAPIG